MDFSLSPQIDPKVKDELRRFEYQDRVHAEKTYADLQAGKPVLDFLALEQPLIKKRIQRQEQRTRKQQFVRLVARSQRDACIARAQSWLKFFQEPFLKDGRNLYRREVRADGKEHIGARGAVVGIIGGAKAERVKDRTIIEVSLGVDGHNQTPWKMERNTTEQPELEFIKPWCESLIEVSKPNGPVPEPTPTITGWERGEVEHKRRAGLRRIERNKDQDAFAIK